jgi:hypothetical protein
MWIKCRSGWGGVERSNAELAVNEGRESCHARDEMR